MTREKESHDMRSLGYLLNRWGRQLELMRFWHGFPTIEATYRAFFGPGEYSGLKIPIPNIDSDIVRLNLRVLALSNTQQDALVIYYGYSTRPQGGYFSDGQKAAMLAKKWKAQVTETELRSRVHFAKKQLLTNLHMVQSPSCGVVTSRSDAPVSVAG